MRINRVIAALFLLIPFAAAAQFNKGKWAAGTTLSYVNNTTNSSSITNSSSSTNSSSNFYFGLQGEKFIRNNFSLGLGYQMTYSGSSTSSQSFNDSGMQISKYHQSTRQIWQGLGGLATVYFPFSARAGMSLGFSAFYNRMANRNATNGYNMLTNYNADDVDTKYGNRIMLNLVPRVYVFLNSHLNLNFSLGDLHYYNTFYKHPDENFQNTQHMALQFNLFNYTLGAQWVF